MQVYLNGNFLPATEAKVSAFDRGFIFGDGVYEVIPVYKNKYYMIEEHYARMQRSLKGIFIEKCPLSYTQFYDIAYSLLEKNGENRPLYWQITRGNDIPYRRRTIDKNITPTNLLFSLEEIDILSSQYNKGVKVVTANDIRWQMCNIKAITLLAAILIQQQHIAAGKNDFVETLLFKDKYLTEGGSSNVFLVKQGEIITPILDNRILPGLTRQKVIEVVKNAGFTVIEKNIDYQELITAEEVWISSSLRAIWPVTQINNMSINNGIPGKIWQTVIKLYLDNMINNLS